MRLILTRLRKIKIQIDMQKCLFDIIKIKYFDLIIIIKDIYINIKKVFVILH